MYISFTVTKQSLKRSDSEAIVADSKNYLKAQFFFSNDWEGLNKIAQFTKGENTYNADITSGECFVPGEVLAGEGIFKVNVFGGDLITVNECTVAVGKSGLKEGQLPAEPTPGYFQSVLDETASSAYASAQSASDALQSATTATTQAGIATTKAEEASTSANSAKASEDNAKVSEDNAKTSETNAGTSEQTVAQAMADYLAMVGVDIATLVGGKVPMAQIPATAIQDIFEISSEDELVTKVAQRGDLAEVIETINGERTVTKTYQLLGDGDATIIDNWVVWGTSYAVQAGNATTATNATDSTMINGHRVVAMTQTQYDVAVKDPDTVYLVG